MFRRVALVVVAVTLVACSNCDNKCTQGITFLVSNVAGALARGSSEPLTICFDGTCHDVKITRANAGGSVFLPFTGVGNKADHDLTVTGTGSFKGEYHGPVASYSQEPGGGCKTCALATVKIGADGTLTPGVVAIPASTTTSVVAPTATVAAP
ncbi:MAG: hypothetical protein ABI949_17600 [Ilumatobacteraceae bacterium]